MNFYSPIAGTVLGLESVPDPVFSSLMLGPGCAINPSETGVMTVLSPCDGEVTSVRSHAVVVSSCLVHAGIDTHKSDALTALVKEGDQVSVGTPLITVDLDRLGDLESMVVVTFPQKRTNAWNQGVAPGAQVTVGDLLGKLD